MKNFLILIIFFTFLSCESIKYSEDLGMMISAVANSPEFPVYINNKLCKDIEGIFGACTKRLKSNESTQFSFEAQQYSYRMALQCSRETGIDLSFDIPKGQVFAYIIPNSAYSALRSFTCIGSIYPQDRDYPVSSKFEVRFIVIDQNYLGRESMLIYNVKGKNYLVLGQHAKYSTVWDEKNGKKITSTLKEKTIQQVYSPDKVRAFSESSHARWNYYGDF
jgi:hypothetical protein